MVCYGQDIAFVGELGKEVSHGVHTLPKETPWQWKQIQFIDNLIDVKTHYEKEGSGQALWKP